jgi:hypothetical protein
MEQFNNLIEFRQATYEHGVHLPLGALSCVPQGIEALAHDSGPDDKHFLSRLTRLAHARTSQTAFELLDTALHCARADRIPLCPLYLIFCPHSEHILLPSTSASARTSS